MKKIFVLSMLLILVFAFQATACFNPTDMFATEVVLNKPGASYDLELIRSAANVSFEEGAFVYRSHFDKRVAAILEPIDESGPAEMLKGLSVKIQIPTRNVITTRVSTIVRFELENVVMGVADKDFLASLGYEVGVFGRDIAPPPVPGDDDIVPNTVSISLRKENVSLNINHHQIDGQDRVEFSADIEEPAAFTDELKAEFKKILTSLALDETALDRVDPEVVKIDLEDLAEAVDVDKDSFDFKSAMKTELDWLATSEIISGVDDRDIAETAEVAEAGCAGWNARIVYYKENWLPYNQTDGPMLFRDVDCGGFNPENLPWNDETIILPGPSSVTFESKLVTKWGKIKTGL